jgi:predicted transcriptional regulator
MSTRRLNIGIRTSAERSGALREAMRRVAGGDRAQQEPGLYFETVEELRQILTEKRMELLLAITRHRATSVHQLAGLLGRDYKNVSTDITMAPTVQYDEIQITIDLRQPRAVRAA